MSRPTPPPPTPAFTVRVEPANRGGATIDDAIPTDAELEAEHARLRRDAATWKTARDALKRGMQTVTATQAATVVDNGAFALTAQIRLLSDAVDRLAAREEASVERAAAAAAATRSADAESAAIHKERLRWMQSRMLSISPGLALVWGATTAVFGFTAIGTLTLMALHLWIVAPLEMRGPPAEPPRVTIPAPGEAKP